MTTERLLASFDTRPSGLTSDEARRRLAEHGPNTLERRGRGPTIDAILSQARNPLAWLLLFAAVVSTAVREWADAIVVAGILVLGSVIGAVQERRASVAIAALRARIAARAVALRDGAEVTVASAELVPGDVIALTAGSLVPADAVLLDAKDLYALQAVMTGETLPAEKRAAPSEPDAPLAERRNVVFQGTSVRSGVARAVVVRTGPSSEYGALAARLALRPPETDFDRGIRRFGYLLTRVMVALVFVVFAAGVLRHKPPTDSLLFAIALAVGLAPEMLPAILSITLAHGARAMAARGVVVRRLSAIENFGSMDVLCTDKTGTLTEGTVRLERAVGPDGGDSPSVLRLACWNASLETGLTNPLDDAIRARAAVDNVEAPPPKVDEVPYDFQRKRMSVVVREPDGRCTIITKGAVEPVLSACDHVRTGDGQIAPLDAGHRGELVARFHAWSADGIRALGVATATGPRREAYEARDERAMVFEGFLLFLDPPKAGVDAVVRDLGALGVALKVVTGDQLDVARHLASAIGLAVEGTLTGRQMAAMSDEALWHVAERTTLFAEVDPNQKERIILALRRTGHVVGYMGDGINDAPALHAADVGISVESAVDVARDAADFVLLRRDLDTLRAGIEEGRATFSNTLKYILTTESANFGNMLSMAAASLVLPFLPLLATQVLLNNFLSDMPAMALARDRVDPEFVARPQRWDLTFIRRAMVLFGLVSSVFDGLTFAALMALRVTPETFRTGWFVESLGTELLVALVVRTRRPFWRSRPGRALVVATALVGFVALALPYSPAARWFSLVAMPLPLLALVVGIATAYALTVEGLKRALFARVAKAPRARG